MARDIIFWRKGWPAHKVGVIMMNQGRKVVVRLGADTHTVIIYNYIQI